MTLTLAVAAALLCGYQAQAADRWIKKRHPEELYAYVDTYQCPLTAGELTESIHATMIRSRIRPLTKWESGDIALYVVLLCTPDDEDHWVFQLSVMLARLADERGDIVVSYRHDDQFGSFGRAGSERLLQAVDKAVDAAFTKYLNANFDLVPGAP